MKKHIPNLLTLGNFLSGFLAIILAFSEYKEFAYLLIILGMLFDALDGRVARILNVQSDLGKELDSLADIVTFGVAPAIIIFNYSSNELSVIGIIIVALFPLCGALRLAKFNTQTSKSINNFSGLPITCAGGILALLSTFSNSLSAITILLFTMILSFLMISNIPYPSFKKLKINKHMAIFAVILILTTIIYIIKHPENFSLSLLITFGVYALSGILLEIHNLIHHKKYEIEDIDDEMEIENETNH